jgi:hypothetical protein
MLRRSALRLNQNNLGMLSWRNQNFSHLQHEVQDSPYKDQFRNFWSEPIPWMDREYGPKPKIGDPIPTRPAATTLIVAKNKYANPERVARGEDNDYKVLIRFRESTRRFNKDQFLLPSTSVCREDYLEEWMPILQDGGLHTHYDDLVLRLCAWRSLMADCNTLLIPRNGGSIAEVQGPPGKLRWHGMIFQNPQMMKQLVGILRMEVEDILNQLCPFRNIITPASEMFRFNNRSYVVTIDRIPDMQYTTSMVGESLHWVSPLEAIGRYNAGIMEMPAPNVIQFSELANAFPTFDDVVKGLSVSSVPVDVQPELVRHAAEKVATVLLPGDRSHSKTTEEDRQRSYFRRFTYVRDEPHGVRAVFEERPTDEQDDLSEVLVAEKTAVLIEESQIDHIYSSVEVIERIGEKSQLQQSTLFDPESFKMQDGKIESDGYIRAKKREDPFMPLAKRHAQQLEKSRAEQRDKRAELMQRFSSEARAEAQKKMSPALEAGEAKEVAALEAGSDSTKTEPERLAPN